MRNFPENEETYLHYWQLMKELNNIQELENISNKLQSVCTSTNVSTNSWVNSLFKHSEMLVRNLYLTNHRY